MGINYYSGSGDDVDEIKTQISEVIHNVRNNKPSLVHLDTFRRYEHCGPGLDDNLGYRKSEEITSYIKRDPIEILGNKMINLEIISKTLLEDLANQINCYVKDTFIGMLRQNENYLKQFEMNK